MSDTPRTDAAVFLTIGAGYNSVDPNFARELERENAALREQVVIRDAEIDMWASRCAAAIYMLPETVTGGQLKEAQDRFYLMLEKARKEAQP